jgi:hypothetical protein
MTFHFHTKASIFSNNYIFHYRKSILPIRVPVLERAYFQVLGMSKAVILSRGLGLSGDIGLMVLGLSEEVHCEELIRKIFY